MQFINTKSHGILDYLVGFILISSPFLLGFYHDGWESWVPISLGGLTILMSLFTNYELGALRLLPMTVHLGIDFLAGAFLAASPWIFDFHQVVYWPHVILGLGEILVVVFSSRKPFNKTRVVGYPPAPTQS